MELFNRNLLRSFSREMDIGLRNKIGERRENRLARNLKGESMSSSASTTDQNCAIGKGYRSHSLPVRSRTEMKQVDTLVFA